MCGIVINDNAKMIMITKYHSYLYKAYRRTEANSKIVYTTDSYLNNLEIVYRNSGKSGTCNVSVISVYPLHKIIPAELSGFWKRVLEWQNGN